MFSVAIVMKKTVDFGSTWCGDVCVDIFFFHQRNQHQGKRPLGGPVNVPKSPPLQRSTSPIRKAQVAGAEHRAAVDRSARYQLVPQDNLVEITTEDPGDIHGRAQRTARQGRQQVVSATR